LAGAFVYLYQNNETFRNNMDAIGRFFRDKFPQYFRAAFEAVLNYFKFYYGIYAAIARFFNRTFLDETTLWSKTVTNLFGKMFDGLKTIVETVFGTIRLLFTGFTLITGGIWKLFTNVITGNWQGMFAALQQIANGGLQLLKASFLLLTLPLRFIWSLFSDEIKVIWQLMWGAITRATSTAFNLIRDTFHNIRDTILGVLGGVFGSVVSIVQNIIDQVARAVAAISSIPSAVPGVGIARGIGSIVGGIIGRIPGLANGGLVTSPTLAMVGEAGPEMVIPLDKMGGMGTTLYVTVSGSVISERDLIETIRVGLVRSQRSGRSLSN
jgi:phage-related protein